MNAEAAKAKLQERVDLFTKAVRGKEKPDRIPHFGNTHTWFIQDAGYQLSDALYDNETMKKVMRYVLENYPGMDTHFWTGHRNPVLIDRALGKEHYLVDEERGTINVKDVCVLNADEYDELQENITKFRLTKALPRLAPGLAGSDNRDKFKNAIQEYRDYIKTQDEITKMMKEEYGVPVKSAFFWGDCGLDMLFNYLRGIKGLSIDMRRQFEKVVETCQMLEETQLKYSVKDPDDSFYGRTDAAFDINFTLLSHILCNTKQFERLIWPALKRLGEVAEKYDKIVFVFGEGNHERFYDFYRDLPDGRFCFLPEQDDLFKFKKACPNITVCGGMPQTLLASGTKEECVNYARRLCEELGDDGRFIFSTDKMISYRNDAKAENLRAVTEFVAEYRR